MSRVRGRKQYISLVQGLNTEASPLNAPEGSTSDELNMILDTDGMVRRRRRGLEAVSDELPVETGEDATINGAYYWASENLIVAVVESTVEHEPPEPEPDPFQVTFLGGSGQTSSQACVEMDIVGNVNATGGDGNYTYQWTIQSGAVMIVGGVTSSTVTARFEGVCPQQLKTAVLRCTVTSGSETRVIDCSFSATNLESL